MQLPRLLQPKSRTEATPLRPAFKVPRLDAESSAERASAALFYGVGIMILATVIRFAGIAEEPFWHDEITMLNIGLGGWDELVYQFNTGRPPVFVFIGVVWTALFGTGEVISRIPSLVAGVLSVGVLFHLGSLMFNQRVGLLAALVMTLTEFHIYYAQTYRYYAVYVLMVLLSYLFFYTMLKRGRWYDSVLYLLFSALALYTHAHGVFAIASQGIYFLVMLVLYPQWRNRRLITKWIGTQVLLVLIILPGLWQYFLADFLATRIPLADAVVISGDMDVSLGWLGQPTIGSIARALVRFLWFEWYYFNPFGVLTALLFLLVGTAVYASRIGKREWGKALRQLFISTPLDCLPEWGLVLSWFVGMIALPWFLSFILTPMFFDRYILGASPAFYLLLVLIVFSIRRVVPIQVTMLAFLVSLLPGLIAFYAYPDNERWQDVTNYISTNQQPDDAVVVLTSDVHLAQPLEAFNWYSTRTADCTLYEDRLESAATVRELTDCLDGHDRVWLTGIRWMGDYERLSATGLSGSLIEFFDTYDSGNWRLVESWEGQSFYLLGLYLYKRSDSSTSP